MIISNQRLFGVTILDSTLTKVSTIKFPGVTLDENFIFNDHVNKVTTKISESVGVMRRLHFQLPADGMANFYYSLVYSHLTYDLPSLAYGRSGSTNAAKIECAHMQESTQITHRL